jgi:hypothetical protein
MDCRQRDRLSQQVEEYLAAHASATAELRAVEPFKDSHRNWHKEAVKFCRATYMNYARAVGALWVHRQTASLLNSGRPPRKSCTGGASGHG